MSKQKRQTIDNLRKSSVPEAALPVESPKKQKTPCFCLLFKTDLVFGKHVATPKNSSQKKSDATFEEMGA